MGHVGDTTHAGKLIDRWTLLTWLGVGAFMFWGAGHYTVFDDEANSCPLYVLSMGEMFRALWDGIDPDPPLYYVLQNLWVRVFGVGPLGLRSLSILFFLAGLVAMRAAAAAWFDRQTGLVTLLICALHPAHLFFGFAGRWYSLMFLMVGLLLWLSSRLSDRGFPRRIVAWALCAAGVCYTNYLGPVVVGMVWFVSMARDRHRPGGRKRWALAALGTALLYVIWFVPFWEQVASFDRPEAAWLSYVATAARTLVALLTGNLASIGAWWVWVPMSVFSVAFLALLITRWSSVWPIAVMVLGCFSVGVASRTMIDKYIMTFSGPACLLVAALLIRAEAPTTGKAPASLGRRLSAFWPRLMIVGLAFGWFGCGVNLVSQRQWSSLRWLDPCEEVTRSLYEQNWHRTYPDAVASHPSARYYFARLRANDRLLSPLQKTIAPMTIPNLRTDRTDWRLAHEAQESIDDTSPYYAVTPAAVTPRLVSHAAEEAVEVLPVIITLETPGFVSLPEWDALNAVLLEQYEPAGEPVCRMEDDAAAWKDRLDPRFRHPRCRIVLRYWRLRSYED